MSVCRPKNCMKCEKHLAGCVTCNEKEPKTTHIGLQHQNKTFYCEYKAKLKNIIQRRNKFVLSVLLLMNCHELH